MTAVPDEPPLELPDREGQRRRRPLLAAIFGAVTLTLVRALGATWRIRVTNPAPWAAVTAERAQSGPVMGILWHSQQLPIAWHHRHCNALVLISDSRIGDIGDRVVKALGYRTARGTAYRRGTRGLLAITRELARGGAAVVTPDGPRGPAESVAPGFLFACARTSALVIPIAAAARPAWRLPGWDRFLLPLPFARVSIAYGEPFRVRADTPDVLQAETRRVQAALRKTVAAVEIP